MHVSVRAKRAGSHNNYSRIIAMRNFAQRHPDLFCQFRWWRKLVGGRWENWYVDLPVCSFLWHWIDNGTQHLKCYVLDGKPSPLCRGTPDIEYYD